MEMSELKHKLRELKKMEHRIRFPELLGTDRKKYVWNEFFSTSTGKEASIKYPMEKLILLDKQQLKLIYEEYFYCVYFQLYKDNGIDFDDIQDLSVLSYFGLAPGASIEQIKTRFKELAQKYHPDHGGSNEKMVEILEVYSKVRNNKA